ncbi:unnamed protein product [Onchocerca flexuosa]|uniref:Ovule protein n=1 Tax=Onchocerca flexuosa TaxID=387005 RepID=A0A183H740_9BILA|nr:unnamed protein product [Onchocerca flexuosa]
MRRLNFLTPPRTLSSSANRIYSPDPNTLCFIMKSISDFRFCLKIRAVMSCHPSAIIQEVKDFVYHLYHLKLDGM